MRMPFNAQAISAVNPKIVIEEYPHFFYYSIFIFLLIISLNFVPGHFFIKLPKVSFIIHCFHCYVLFIFLFSIYNDLHEANNKSLLDLSSNYFSFLNKILFEKRYGKPLVLEASDNVKNLILVQLESYPNEFVRNSNVAPNLHKFSQNYEHIAPIYMQPFSGLSIAATSVLQIGIPQIFPDVKAGKTEAQSPYLKGIYGLPDIIHSYHYSMDYITKGKNTIMGFGLNLIIIREYLQAEMMKKF